MLCEAKKELPHGSFLPWVENEVECDPQWAQKLMKVAKHRDLLPANTNSSLHLGINDAYQHIRSELKAEKQAPPPEESEDFDGCTVDDLHALAAAARDRSPAVTSPAPAGRTAAGRR
ncbi:DUF3102 domain-containing protein [Alienimonas sp. DA493]|uniref:DUF3102 domain-containing protein n=1 Tax=Alienimonas sp. DA493 TaxID=3373605 RepID=UPI003755148D